MAPFALSKICAIALIVCFISANASPENSPGRKRRAIPAGADPNSMGREDKQYLFQTSLKVADILNGMRPYNFQFLQNLKIHPDLEGIIKDINEGLALLTYKSANVFVHKPTMLREQGEKLQDEVDELKQRLAALEKRKFS